MTNRHASYCLLTSAGSLSNPSSAVIKLNERMNKIMLERIRKGKILQDSLNSSVYGCQRSSEWVLLVTDSMQMGWQPPSYSHDSGHQHNSSPETQSEGNTTVEMPPQRWVT